MMRDQIIVIFFVNLYLSTHSLLVEQLEVETEFGAVIGVEHETYTSFEGIPYAEPPIGELRFEPPFPLRQKWPGVLNASVPGNPCHQWFGMDEQDEMLEGSEDCLFLNIYRPKGLNNDKLPVIFHIHGGTLMMGQGDDYGPDFITKRPLILVNFNYRLGALGFLSTESSVIPGNMGLKDQVAALKWIKRNIDQFGGDPDKITIAGFSAGSACAHLHILSNLTAGLFNNAILHSGTALGPYTMQRNPLHKFQQIVRKVECGHFDDVHDQVKCLKEKPIQNILRSIRQFYAWSVHPIQPFGAVVESAENGFLTDFPTNLMESGHVNGRAWILSTTADEGLGLASALLDSLPYLNEHWNEVSPSMLLYNFTAPPEKLNEISEKVKRHYLGEREMCNETFTALVDIFTDRMFHSNFDKTLRIQSKFIPTYCYYYNFSFENSIVKYFHANHENHVGHGDDIYTIYASKYFKVSTDKERQMQEHFLDMYELFANNETPKIGPVTMVQIDLEKDIQYLRVNGPSEIIEEVSSGFGEHEFWNSLEFDEL